MGIAELARQGFQYFIKKSFDELPLSFLVWSLRFCLMQPVALGMPLLRTASFLRFRA